MPSVLVVDDAEDLLEMAQIGFEMAGWECWTATNGKDAAQLAAQHSPQVVLLDFDLPGENGLAIFARLKENPANAGIPVIFLTGTTHQGERESILGAGARGIITKPFDPLSLAQQVTPYLA